MISTVPVELRCDEYDSKRVVWPVRKLAFYLLASETLEPKYENSAGTEWILTYPMEARWDKSLMSKELYESLAREWRKPGPIEFRPSLIEKIRVIAEWSPGKWESVGVTRDLQPMFNQVLRECLPSIRYEQFDYRLGEPRFVSEVRANLVCEIDRFHGMDVLPQVRAMGETPVKAVLFGYPEPGWKAPYMFTDE